MDGLYRVVRPNRDDRSYWRNWIDRVVWPHRIRVYGLYGNYRPNRMDRTDRSYRRDRSYRMDWNHWAGGNCDKHGRNGADRNNSNWSYRSRRLCYKYWRNGQCRSNWSNRGYRESRRSRRSWATG